MRRKKPFTLSREQSFNIFMVASGVIMILISEVTRDAIQQSFQHQEWLTVAGLAMPYTIMLCGGVGLCLVPFRANRFVGFLLKVLGWPLGIAYVILKIGTLISSPFTLLFVLLAIYLAILNALQAAGIIYSSDLKPFLYPFFTILFLVFSLQGDKFIQWWIHLGVRKQEFSEFMYLYKPKMIRFYLYVFTAVTYFLIKQEQFANISLISATWWTTYKDMASEILLTFVAIDAVFGAWKDRNI